MNFCLPNLNNMNKVDEREIIIEIQNSRESK